MDTNRAPASPFRTLANFRDVGGLETADGRWLRSGLLFRSEDPSRIAADEQDALRRFGIRTICDLRSAEERRRRRSRLAQASLPIAHVPIDGRPPGGGGRAQLFGFLFGRYGGERFREFSTSYYRHLAFGQAAAVGKAVALLADASRLPALFHCSGGKDRTGFLAALIQSLAGVPYDAVLDDYLRTNACFEARLRRLVRVMRGATLGHVSEQRMREVLMAHPEHLTGTYDEILRRHGTIEGYLREACGVPPSTIDRLRRLLLA